MKKFLIALGFLVLILAVLIIGSLGDEPLSPAAEKELVFEFPVVAPEDNIYVGIFGLGQPEDGDVVTAGLKLLTGDSDWAALKDSARQPYEFHFTYTNPCKERKAQNCLDQIAADALTINDALQKNRGLLDRYVTVRKMPTFANVFSYSHPWPPTGALVDVSRFMEGVFNIV